AVAGRQLDRHELRDAGFGHRHAVEDVRGLHRELVVRDHDELGALAHAVDHRIETAEIRLVERRIDLVQHAERRRPEAEEGHEKADRREGLLAARQGLERAEALARGLDLHLDAAVEQALRVRELEARAPAAEELPEELLELLVRELERLAEAGAGRAAELRDRAPEVFDRRLEVAPLPL